MQGDFQEGVIVGSVATFVTMLVLLALARFRDRKGRDKCEQDTSE
jgi:hypothetical protein